MASSKQDDGGNNKDVTEVSAEVNNLSILENGAEQESPKPCATSKSEVQEQSEPVAGPSSGNRIGIYDDWNPMEFEYQTGGGVYDPDDIGAAILGENASSETPCVFHDGFSGSCWKGPSCIYSHRYFTGGRFLQSTQNYNVGVRNDAIPISHAYCLLSKPIIPKNTMLPVRVIHTDTPGVFYVSPFNNWACVCKLAGINDIPEKNLIDQDTYFGEKQVEEMQKALTKMMIRSKTHFQMSNYAIQQLVAVRIKDSELDIWVRGMVTEPWFANQEEKEGVSKVQVQLLDMPLKMEVMPNDVASLPVHFARLHPAYYKCSLYGISPIGRIWTRNARCYFKNLTNRKLCLIEIKQSIEPLASYSLFEDEPYQVRVIVLDKGKNYDPAKKLIDNNYAIAWNPIPSRPFIGLRIPYHLVDFYAQESSELNLPDSVLEEEKQRLMKKFQRTGFDIKGAKAKQLEHSGFIHLDNYKDDSDPDETVPGKKPPKFSPKYSQQLKYKVVTPGNPNVLVNSVTGTEFKSVVNPMSLPSIMASLMSNQYRPWLRNPKLLSKIMKNVEKPPGDDPPNN